MVGPIRPVFVLFGSSIVQFSYGWGGWGATLNLNYSRKADIILRGYFGWTSAMALQVLDKVFPKDADIQPSLVILYFGGNDSVDPQFPDSTHVPLPQYVYNMREIANHIMGLSENTRLIMLSTPPVNEKQIVDHYGDNRGRTLVTSGKYSEACKELGKEMGVEVIDVWSAIQERPDWLTTCFRDGMHFTKEGSDIVFEKISQALKNNEALKTLYWENMKDEFSDILIADSDLKIDDGKKQNE